MDGYIQQKEIQVFLFQYRTAFIVFSCRLGYFANAINCAEALAIFAAINLFKNLQFCPYCFGTYQCLSTPQVKQTIISCKTKFIYHLPCKFLNEFIFMILEN